jgi:RHS repeat-associated protein
MTAKGITGGVSTTIPVDGGSNRLIGPSYDAAGNVLSRDGLEAYEYDSFNMLSKYRRPLAAFPYTLEMVYDPDDERLGVLLQDGSSRWSVRDLGGQVIREYDGFRNGNDLILMWQADYIRGEGGQLLAGETPAWQYNDQNGNGTTTAQYGGLRHYHLDHLGSVRLVTDAQKHTLGEHDYFPYGVTPTKAYQEELNPGTPHIDPMRYAGHQRDFLGYLNVENTDYLDYMHARYYDPKLGRFLSVDPHIGDPQVPQSWNRYTYALNNPIKFIDPTGKDCTTLPIAEDGADQVVCTDEITVRGDPVPPTNAEIAMGVFADVVDQTVYDIIARPGVTVAAGLLNDNGGQIASGVGQIALAAVPGGVASGLTRTLGATASSVIALPELTPTLTYGARVEARALATGDLYHNFPQVIDEVVTSTGQIRSVSESYVEYSLRGAVNSVAGQYEIDGRPFIDGMLGVTHRFFRPFP